MHLQQELQRMQNLVPPRLPVFRPSIGQHARTREQLNWFSLQLELRFLLSFDYTLQFTLISLKAWTLCIKTGMRF
jgi:hypothetical protein